MSNLLKINTFKVVFLMLFALKALLFVCDQMDTCIDAKLYETCCQDDDFEKDIDQEGEENSEFDEKTEMISYHSYDFFFKSSTCNFTVYFFYDCMYKSESVEFTPPPPKKIV